MTPTAIFLIVLMVVVPCMFVVLNLSLMKMYLHPQDAGKAWFPKIVIVLGLLVSEVAVLLLPLDVANGAGMVGCDTYRSEYCQGPARYRDSVDRCLGDSRCHDACGNPVYYLLLRSQFPQSSQEFV